MARSDGRERAAFRNEVQESIRENNAFEFLVDEDGNWHSDSMGWRDQEGNVHDISNNGFHSNEGNSPGWVDTDWDAGHTISYQEGEPNYYAIEDRSQNRSDAALEREGMILEKNAVEIKDNAVNEDLAQMWEDRGLLEENTVENAPDVMGWNIHEGIVEKDQETGIMENDDAFNDSSLSVLNEESEESVDDFLSEETGELSDEDLNSEPEEDSYAEENDTSMETESDASADASYDSDGAADGADGDGGDGGDGGE